MKNRIDELINEASILENKIKKAKIFSKFSHIGIILSPFIIFLGKKYNLDLSMILHIAVGSEITFFMLKSISEENCKELVERNQEIYKEIRSEEYKIKKEQERAKSKILQYENQNTLSYNYGEDYSLNNDIGYSRRRKLK